MTRCLVCAELPCSLGVLCQPCSRRLESDPAVSPEQIRAGAVTAGELGLLDAWGRVHLVAEGVIIGRDLGDHLLSILSHRVSREHAVVEADREGYFIRDLGSTNGTTLQRQPVRGRARLHHGDMVHVAGVGFYVHTGLLPRASTSELLN